MNSLWPQEARAGNHSLKILLQQKGQLILPEMLRGYGTFFLSHFFALPEHCLVISRWPYQRWPSISLSRRGQNTTPARLRGLMNKRTRLIKRKYYHFASWVYKKRLFMLRRWCHTIYLILCFSLPTHIKNEAKIKSIHTVKSYDTTSELILKFLKRENLITIISEIFVLKIFVKRVFVNRKEGQRGTIFLLSAFQMLNPGAFSCALSRIHLMR